MEEINNYILGEVMCDNTCCHKHVKTDKKYFKVILTEDFNNDECIWCEGCCEIDKDMIESKTLYATKGL